MPDTTIDFTTDVWSYFIYFAHKRLIVVSDNCFPNYYLSTIICFQTKPKIRQIQITAHTTNVSRETCLVCF